jgi:hypothetical protein
MTKQTSERPNGPVAAAMLAGGIGAAVLGVATLLVEIVGDAVKKPLTWNKAVGALSGKSGLGIIAFLVSWAVLYFILKDKETKFEQMAAIALAGLGIGLLFTFPPFWHLLAGG